MAAVKYENWALRRRLSLLELIRKYFNSSPASVAIFISKEELDKNPLLKDFDGLWRALKKIEEDLRPDFEYRLRWDLSQGDAPKTPSFGAWLYQGTEIEITAEDHSSLERYQNEIERALKKEQEQYQFILTDIDKHKAELSLEGNAAKSPQMRTNSRRYKLLRHLTKQKEPISTQDLADFLTATDKKQILADDVRSTVEEIRTVVSKSFNIPREAIIQNDRSGSGYFVDNVRLAGATRDTL